MAQIVVLDAVFSLDAVITAVGMVDHLSVMMIGVIISIGLMMVASKPLTAFVNAHPTVIMLCLGFLMMIGFSLTAEGLGFHIPKGYLYAAIGFSILIEVFNQTARRKRKRFLHGQHLTMRDRTAFAVMRLLGGRAVEAEEVGEEVVDLVEGGDTNDLFGRRERLMISGVLQLAEQSIKMAMTDRMEVDHLALEAPIEQIHQALLDSPYSRLVVAQSTSIDQPLGYVQKKELLREMLRGGELDIEPYIRAPINLPDSCTVLNALDQMRQASTHVAFVVNEFGNFEGLLTLTDILESIAGELPDASEVEGPDIEETRTGYEVNGGLPLSVVRQRIGFPAQATDDYQTLGGLVMSLLDRLPRTGDEVSWSGWSLKVSDVEERRVTRVALTRPESAG